jgi:hypothetical protein
MVYYDSFVLKDYAHDRSHYGVIEYRRYDAGHYDEIKGKYQSWWNNQYQSKLTKYRWNLYYDQLSEEEKQKFINACNQRKVEKNDMSIQGHPDLRPMSELLNGLKDLYDVPEKVV